MSEKSKELANLARIGKLAIEPGEIKGLLTSGNERLADARNEGLALSSRFDLAYNAAHAFSLAALRWHGYRSDSRYLVFQALPHTLGQPTAVWRVLAKAHEVRNVAEGLCADPSDARQDSKSLSRTSVRTGATIPGLASLARASAALRLGIATIMGWTPPSL